jgi:hypothetical protein
LTVERIILSNKESIMKRRTFLESLSLVLATPVAMGDITDFVANPFTCDQSFGQIHCQVFPNMTRGILVVTVGNEKTPATKNDMERVANTIDEVYEGTKVVSIIVPHLVTLENSLDGSHLVINVGSKKTPCTFRDKERVDGCIADWLGGDTCNTDKHHLAKWGEFSHQPKFYHCDTDPDNEKLKGRYAKMMKTVAPNISKGSLLAIAVGDDNIPATKKDMQFVAGSADRDFKENNGISVLVMPHLIKLQRLDFPRLTSLKDQKINYIGINA